MVSVFIYFMQRCCCCSVMSDSFETLWTIACQALLSMGFSRQECWVDRHSFLQGIFSDPGIRATLPAIQTDSLPLSHWWHPKRKKFRRLSDCSKLYNSNKFRNRPLSDYGSCTMEPKKVCKHTKKKKTLIKKSKRIHSWRLAVCK